MSEEEAMLLAIKNNPDDNTVRLVFADWLDERSRHEEAEAWRRLPHRKSPFEPLIGRTITEVRTNRENFLVFDTDIGPASYEAEGDCCSDSWFFRVLNADKIIGSRLVAVAEGRNDVNENDGLCRQESESIYNYALIGTRGVCEITFRNSSNGYYGGWLTGHYGDDKLNGGGFSVTGSWQVPAPINCQAGSSPECACPKCLIPGA